MKIKKATRIVICDDHILFLRGIKELLKTLGHYSNITTFSNTIECQNFIKTNSIDIFICDLNINGSDGFVLFGALRKELKQVKTIILTAYLEDFLIDKAKNLGINAFLKKETSAEELINVIESGKDAPFYSNKTIRPKANYFSNQDNNIIRNFRLTRQEKEIIKQVIDGKTSAEIAEKLDQAELLGGKDFKHRFLIV